MEWLEEAAIARGQPLPDIVRNKPRLRPDGDFYWLAYQDLISCANERGIIPWTAYDQYAQRYGEQTERLKRIVGALVNGSISDRHKNRHGGSE